MIHLCMHPSDQLFPGQGKKQDWRRGVRPADAETRCRLCWWDECYLIVLFQSKIDCRHSTWMRTWFFLIER
jgi:hypothetical protein